VDEETRNELIARYREGPEVVRRALEGITEPELDHRPVGGDWSARQVVQHLADSEMTSAIRLRTLIAEDNPTIRGYDEGGFADIFRYSQRPIEPALMAMDAARATTVQILEFLEPAQWERAGTHTESGPYSVEDWLRTYALHAHDHAEQIDRVRATYPAQAEGAP
jgi:DinB superfamily